MLYLVMGIVELLTYPTLRITEAYTDADFYVTLPRGMSLPPFLPGDLLLVEMVDVEEVEQPGLPPIFAGTAQAIEILDEVGKFRLCEPRPSEAVEAELDEFLERVGF